MPHPRKYPSVIAQMSSVLYHWVLNRAENPHLNSVRVRHLDCAEVD